MKNECRSLILTLALGLTLALTGTAGAGGGGTAPDGGFEHLDGWKGREAVSVPPGGSEPAAIGGGASGNFE